METTRECLWLRSQFWLHVYTYTYTYNVVHMDGKIPSYESTKVPNCTIVLTQNSVPT
ncbi:uncharacterized protein MICPUCDRAFT_55643 [Micromonas pusilla CCMP1545]|uniref:Predicted protein n=1 Tax=Micromonas pusilla (strain CCMP1545) TaxID=564608 RepID=C1MLA6_MICPC|nr:uncharacterized protein MICPUCDRAFT_55643 [Micromonas pusilla CCMP1545]EEH59902.1 predicted protein [Micromonas pusilla CCMP1545]|eukprot:XP_003056526.1 predicted protein [Micromonas pusilla CCMP1545]